MRKLMLQHNNMTEVDTHCKFDSVIDLLPIMPCFQTPVQSAQTHFCSCSVSIPSKLHILIVVQASNLNPTFVGIQILRNGNTAMCSSTAAIIISLEVHRTGSCLSIGKRFRQTLSRSELESLRSEQLGGGPGKTTAR